MALPGIYDIFQERWGKGQSCFIYSDPHFSDMDLECGIKNRPSDEEQIRRINAKCGRKDTLIILGDIGNIECVKHLRAAYKILIMGNHDSGKTNYTDIFDEVYEGVLVIGEKLILSHEPIAGLNWALNLHGHVHDKQAKTDAYHINCCSDVIGYEPINLNQLLKSGPTAHIQSIHRQIIDSATKRKRKRNKEIV